MEVRITFGTIGQRQVWGGHQFSTRQYDNNLQNLANAKSGSRTRQLCRPEIFCYDRRLHRLLSNTLKGRFLRHMLHNSAARTIYPDQSFARVEKCYSAFPEARTSILSIGASSL